jgi:hypothetical protein
MSIGNLKNKYRMFLYKYVSYVRFWITIASLPPGDLWYNININRSINIRLINLYSCIGKFKRCEFIHFCANMLYLILNSFNYLVYWQNLYRLKQMSIHIYVHLRENTVHFRTNMSQFWIYIPRWFIYKISH